MREKIAHKIIDKGQPQWQEKKVNRAGQEVEIPSGLDGQVLIEEVCDQDGYCRGWITIAESELADLRHRINDPRQPETEETTGLKNFFDDLRRQGVSI